MDAFDSVLAAVRVVLKGFQSNHGKSRLAANKAA